MKSRKSVDFKFVQVLIYGQSYSLLSDSCSCESSYLVSNFCSSQIKLSLTLSFDGLIDDDRAEIALMQERKVESRRARAEACVRPCYARSHNRSTGIATRILEISRRFFAYKNYKLRKLTMYRRHIYFRMLYCKRVSLNFMNT